jgi:hypothetical protein
MLDQIVRADPHFEIRQQAILSLLRWKRDAYHCAATIRNALNDPSEQARYSAQYWLREFDQAKAVMSHLSTAGDHGGGTATTDAR